MELAIISGRGPAVLTDIEGLQPLVQDEAIIAFGCRDRQEQQEHGSQDIRATGIHAFELEQIRALGSATAAQQGIERLQRHKLSGFWIHLVADLLDDAIMPAVDYRLSGGLQWDELTTVENYRKSSMLLLPSFQTSI